MVRNNKADCLKKIPREKILIESDGPFTKVNGKKYLLVNDKLKKDNNKNID